MCNYWSLWARSPCCWAVAWGSGWATGWLTGAARNASWLSQTPMPRIRTPLLKLQIEQLRLNANAPFRRPRREAAKLLLLRK